MIFRPRNLDAPWLWLLLLVAGAAACTTDDTGKLCNDPNVSFTSDPITGEVPVIEVVDMSRDSACETFDCLKHEGLPAYCTRSCTYNKAPAKPTACTSDSQCNAPLHCYQGICNNDDCPAGFWCQTVESVGPLSNQLYCVRRNNCKIDLDCGSLGSIACTTLGCYDACYMQQTSCAFHQLTCSPLTSLGCTCQGGGSTCGDADLTCKPPGVTQSWPPGIVTQVGVCLPK